MSILKTHHLLRGDEEVLRPPNVQTVCGEARIKTKLYIGVEVFSQFIAFRVIYISGCILGIYITGCTSGIYTFGCNSGIYISGKYNTRCLLDINGSFWVYTVYFRVCFG